MSEWLVELSAENLDLAREELRGAVEALGGRVADGPAPVPRFERVELSDATPARRLVERLALSRRVVRPWPRDTSVATLAQLEREAASAPGGASFRPAGHRRSTSAPGAFDPWVRAWKRAGGHLDLSTPQRRFLVAEDSDGPWLLGEEVGTVDRPALEAHRMPNLPFQRPVSLRPKLARAAMNLAAVRPGDRVVDPFVGTGALLLEAALLGARVCGVDRDAEMLRGAARNLAHLDVAAERLVVDDAASAAGGFEAGSVQAVVTDPPYGRASGAGGEDVEVLVRRAMRAWSDRVAPGGRIVLITPGGPDPLAAPWVRRVCVRDRVHRSLTREFRVYERAGSIPEAASSR